MGYAILLGYMIFSYVLCKRANASRNFIIGVFFVGLFVFIGFRGELVGRDTYQYMLEYGDLSGVQERLSSITSISTFLEMTFTGSGPEPGYLALLYLLNQITSNPQMLLLAEALVVCICYRKVFIEYVDDVFVGMLVFMTFGLLDFFLSGIRQSFALSFGVLAYLYIVKKKYGRAALFMFLTVLFHRSGWIFDVILIGVALSQAPILSKIKWNLAFSVVLGGFSFLLLPQLQSVLASSVEKWAAYGSVEQTGNGYVFFAVVACISVLCEMHKRNIEKEVPDSIFHYKMLYLYFIFWMLRLETRTIERICLYFATSLLILFPYAIQFDIKKGGKRSIEYIIILLILALYVYRYFDVEYTLFFL